MSKNNVVYLCNEQGRLEEQKTEEFNLIFDTGIVLNNRQRNTQCEHGDTEDRQQQDQYCHDRVTTYGFWIGDQMYWTT